MTAMLGGCGNCARMGNEVFEKSKNGATTLGGVAVGSGPRWMGNERFQITPRKILVQLGTGVGVGGLNSSVCD